MAVRKEDIDGLQDAFAKLSIRPSKTQRRAPYHGGLLGLPPEMLNTILHMIVRKRDQVALLLVCKQLRTLVLPMLYHTVVLDSSDAAGLQSFASANPGHQHLYNLTVIPTGRQILALTYLCRLKQVLPRGTLRTFHFPSPGPESRNHFAYLQIDGRALSNAIIVDDGRPSTFSESPLFDAYLVRLSRCTTATVFVQSSVDQTKSIEREMKVLRRSLRLTAIEADFVLSSGRDLPLNTGSLITQMIGEANGANCLKLEYPPGLTQVTLRGARLLAPEALSYATAQGLGRLTTLVLQDCVYCSCLLYMIAVGGTSIRWKKLVICGGQNHGFDLMPVVDVVLRKFTGLHTLVISTTEEGVPSEGAILNHSSTLKELYIDVDLPIGMIYHRGWYRTVCSSCNQLEQVALPLPPVRLGHPDTKVWLFREHLEHILLLPKLITLRVLDVARGDTSMDPAVSAGLADFLAAWLSRTFKSRRRKELSLIALGREGGYGQVSEDQMLCYLVKNSKGYWRNDGESGVVRMKKADAMAEEPRSEILEIQHHKKGFLRFPRWQQ